MRVLIFACLLAASLAAQAADTFRCKNDLVQVGDSKVSVITKCGEPMIRDSSCQVLAADRTTTVYDGSGRPLTVAPAACETVDEWTYNPGVGDFYTTIRMERGVITSIKYGDRVK